MPLRWIALTALVLMASCAGTAPAGPPPKLIVAAASSLQPLFHELGERFQEESGADVIFSFGATGTLTHQIEQGAPIDVFAAADPSFMDRLERQGLIAPGTYRTYAFGQLVLVANRKAGPAPVSLEALLDPQVRYVAMANPETAPYGAAAREALRSAGLWTRLQPKLVYGENVRQALQFVETGNAEMGLVARSLADAEVLAVTPLDPELHPPIVQTIGVLRGSAQPELAQRFVDLVTGPMGAAALGRHGYGPSSSGSGP